MVTLLEYAHELFPHHDVRVDGEAPELPDHTVVAQVLGSGRMRVLEDRARTKLAGTRIVTVNVQPTTQSVVPSGGEDREAVIDLPPRRIAAVAGAGAVGAGLILGLIVGFVSGSALVGVIVGVFAAAMGAIIGAVAGGGGRYGGERAWQDPNSPDSTIGLMAVFCADEAAATDAASQLEALGIDDVRVLSSDGGWHLPNT